eukprot:4583897-Pleurochrysis_carterae.AAC.1
MSCFASCTECFVACAEAKVASVCGKTNCVHGTSTAAHCSRVRTLPRSFSRSSMNLAAGAKRRVTKTGEETTERLGDRKQGLRRLWRLNATE